MCIVSSFMATGMAAAISSTIAEAASAAAGAIGASLSASTAAAIGSTITATTAGAVVGAGGGAMLGTATSAISGGDIGKGALMGAAGGAATGGVLSGVGEAISASGGITIPTGLDKIGLNDLGHISIGKTTSGAYNAALQSMGGTKDLAAFNPATDAIANMSVGQLNATEMADQYGVNVAGSGVADASVSSQTAQATTPAMDIGKAMEISELGTYGGQAATESQLNTAYQTIADSAKGAGSNVLDRAKDVGGAAGGLFGGLKDINYGKLGLTAAGVGTSLYGSYIGAQTALSTAEAEQREAEGKADQAEIQADISDLKQNAETAAAAEEKAQLAKRRRMLVGQGRAAAAANGIMLESRAEASPAMFEQDAASEMAYEQGKIDYNLRIKNSIHGANAALSRMSAANYRQQGEYARHLGNLKSTTSWISGIANSATGLAGAFL